jgi:epsilon-lactone hydrolase
MQMMVALPDSSLLSPDAVAALRRYRNQQADVVEALRACSSIHGAKNTDISELRECQAKAFYGTSIYKDICARYAVALTMSVIGGVDTEVFTPMGGLAGVNAERVLINLHGGAFESGSRVTSHLESIPIASVGKIRVISVDYRLAPEYIFPAASEDVAAVYEELLKTYKPKNIGICGCSAGGLLTAQAVAWLQRKDLPLPGAVGMFFAAGSFWAEGDSGCLNSLLSDVPLGTAQAHPYFKYADPTDPLVFPVKSDEVLAGFPPSLLIASTRDFGLSSVVHMHSRLVALGVEAFLHVWEGLEHGFFRDTYLSQSREAYDVVVRFFDKRLGAS